MCMKRHVMFYVFFIVMFILPLSMHEHVKVTAMFDGVKYGLG